MKNKFQHLNYVHIKTYRNNNDIREYLGIGQPNKNPVRREISYF